MYTVLRLIACAVILISCSALILPKIKPSSKRKFRVITVAITVLLYLLISVVPFENLFVSFTSPESAYNYFKFGNSNTVLVADGEHCSFVLDRHKDYDSYKFIPKTENGWKLPSFLNAKTVAKHLSERGQFYIYQFDDTDDYFIVVNNINREELKVSDRCDSEFYPLEIQFNDDGEKYYDYYAFIKDYSADYYVTINGSKIRP